MQKTKILTIVVLMLGLVASVANADFTFGTPTNLGSAINSPYDEYEPSISADGLSLFFQSDRPYGTGGVDLYMVSRPTISDAWRAPVNLTSKVNSSGHDGSPCISADGLSLYFESDRPGGSGSKDLWMTTRASITDPWDQPWNLGPVVNTSAQDNSPTLSPDGLELFFSDHPSAPYRSGGHGGADLWGTKRASLSEPWATPTNLGPEVNSSDLECGPSISSDGLLLFFQRFMGEDTGRWDIFVAKRKNRNEPWSQAVNLGPGLNTLDKESNPDISSDGCTLYFVSMRMGGFGGNDLWHVSIIPIVDFNGDGIVDGLDMRIIVDHWGEDYSLCDIGPTPLGDGTVDVEDLKILAEHLFEDVNDSTLIAHWPLDEVQGNIAYNSVANCDGTLMGGPVWQPNGGMVAGALQFDGTDDYVSTDLVLNPADGMFSVIAWIKDGAPGQTILSQANGLNWLCIDSIEGHLMTELTNSGRSPVGPMHSQGNITDGKWHRIGFVWDGSYRHLYVDGIEVAIDPVPLSGLGSTEGGLYIGTGSTLAPGTFFSGLIDDVRIYNRAVKP